MSSYTHLADVDRQIRSYAAFFVGLPAAAGVSRTDIHTVNDRHLGQRGNDWSFTRLFSTRQHSDAYKPFLTTSDPVFIRTPSDDSFTPQAEFFHRNGAAFLQLRGSIAFQRD